MLKWEGKYCGSYEFRLSGNPWWADGEDTVESRYLVGTLLAELKKQGWEVEATLDVSRNMQDKTVFVMKQCPPSKQEWAVIGFHETDKVGQSTTEGDFSREIFSFLDTTGRRRI